MADAHAATHAPEVSAHAGLPTGVSAGAEDSLAGVPEDRERAAAWRRGEARGRARAAGHEPPRSADAGRALGGVAARAFAALAENVRDYAIFLMDPAGVITFWGEGARLIKWWTKDEAEGAHLRILYPAGGAEDGTAEQHLRDAAAHGESVGEGRRVRSDGSTFWAGVTLTALRDEDGALLGFAKVTRDLTARRAADAALASAAVDAEAARAAAVAASAAKSGFLASMSHEIRTPVNAVIGYHELLDLEIDGPLTPGQRRHLERASASGRHLLGLITEVLDFARIERPEAAHEAVARAVVRVGDVVAAALALVAPQARAKGLELADAVSAHAAGLAAWGDEGRVRQILVNLLANAVKFTEPRPGAASTAGHAGPPATGALEPGRVMVSAGSATDASPDARLSGAGPWVYVRVEDTGVGIASDQLGPIFEAFVQADMKLTRQHGGTGLGLAISRRLARLMGGDVTARSEVGVGSTFFLWLPAAPVESVAAEGAQSPHGATASESGAGPLTAFAEQAGVVPPRDVPAAQAATAGSEAGTPAGTPPVADGPLRAVADAVLAELERVLHAYVARLRSDPATPGAHSLAEAHVEDHLASLLADLAATLSSLERGAGVPDGEPPVALGDGTAIQRLVAERHGRQRARLGWQEGEIRREFTILREELAAAVRRRLPGQRVPSLQRGGTSEPPHAPTERALELLAEFVAVAERLSVASYREARQATPPVT